MRVQLQLREDPGGAVVSGAGVRVRRIADGVTLTTLTTDADGVMTYRTSGHPPPFFIETTNAAGGPRFWRSDEYMTAGAISTAEIPPLLTSLGDGVLPLDAGFALDVSGTTLTLNAGVACVRGYPVILYDDTPITVERPSSGTRVDRVVARVYPLGAASDPGYADFALVAGTDTAPDLVQTDDEWQIALWQVRVPASGTITTTDERTEMLSGYLTRPVPVAGGAVATSAATANASGEALSGLTATLALPLAREYDIYATVQAIHLHTAATAPSDELTWVANYGSTGTGNGQFRSPRQIAVDDNDDIYVADYTNNRIQRLSSSGVYEAKLSLDDDWVFSPNGVAVDADSNVYVAGYAYPTGTYAIRFGSDFSATEDWDALLTGSSITTGHLATNSTHVFVVGTSTNRIYRLTLAGGSLTSWGTTGSGTGQLSSPVGIVANDTHVWVADAGNHRVSQFTVTGTHVATFGASGSGSGSFDDPSGLALDVTNALVLVADRDNNRVQRFASGVFVDSAGSFGSGNGQLNGPRGVAVLSGGDVLVSDTGNNRVVRFTGAAGGGSGTPGGYGDVAVEIDGNLSDYLGPGERTVGIGNAHTRTVTGPGTVSVRVFGRATSETLGLRSAVLATVAVPRR